MIQLVLRKLSSPVVLISAFALMVAMSIPLQQRLRSIPSISASSGTLESFYSQSELHLASSQVDLYLDIPRASRITPYLVTAKVVTENISMSYVENTTNPKGDKDLVIVMPPPIVEVVPIDSSHEFTIRTTDASVAYRKGLYDFGLIYARRKALQDNLLGQAKSQLDRYAQEFTDTSNLDGQGGQTVRIDTTSWETPQRPAIHIPSTRLTLQPYYQGRMAYNINYTPDKLSYYSITITDSITNSTLNMSIYDSSTKDLANQNTLPEHNMLRTYSETNSLNITLNSTGFVAMIVDEGNTYSFVAQSPSPIDFTNFLPIALDTLLSLEINTTTKTVKKGCNDIFNNNLDAWLNSDTKTISEYVKGVVSTAFFNPNKIFQTLDIYNTTVIYDKATLDEYGGNIRQLNARLQNIGQSSEVTSQTANFALYSKNALENNQDIYILFLKTRAYVYVYDGTGNNILSKILNYYQLPSNYKVVINSQSLCSSGRLYEHGDDMFCFTKTYIADLIDKLIDNSFVALFKCGLSTKLTPT